VDVIPKLVFSALETLEFLFDNVYLHGHGIANTGTLIKLGTVLLDSIQDELFFEYDPEIYLSQIDLLISIVNILHKNNLINSDTKDFPQTVFQVVSSLDHQSIRTEINKKKETLASILSKSKTSAKQNPMDPQDSSQLCLPLNLY